MARECPDLHYLKVALYQLHLSSSFYHLQPNYIFDVLCKELDTLDKQINALSQKTADLTAKYTDISKFIKEYKRP